MTFYSSTIIVTEILMLAMMLHVVNYSGFTREQKTWYIMTFISIMFCAGAEFAVHCGYYNPDFAPLLTALTVIQFSVAPMLGVLFTGALGFRGQENIAMYFFTANLLTEAVCAPFGTIFYFDAEGYHRGKLFFIYGVFYFVSLIYLLICMAVVAKRYRHRDFWTVIMVLVVVVAGIVPMTFFRINVTYVAIAVAACLCYIYYNDLVQQDIQAELIENQNKISEMQLSMISGLASLIEDRDTDTGGHITRTSAYVKKLAELCRDDGVYAEELTDHFISLLYTLAPMHDIGKIAVPDRILKKPGRLTAEEFAEMKNHAAVGGDVVRKVLSGVSDQDYIDFASDIAACHHERWDGTGYPKGLTGEEIPLAARFMAIADVYDALISERCYKKPMTHSEAFDIIRNESGTHFDPKLAEVFLRHKEDFII